jgi:hypothetical protein
MLELISIVASLVICVLLPIQASKIRKGWVPKNFANDRPKFLAVHRKQFKMLMWLGLVFGILGLAMAPLEDHPGERTVKVIAAAIWFVVSGLGFYAFRTVDKVADADAATSAGGRHP